MTPADAIRELAEIDATRPRSSGFGLTGEFIGAMVRWYDADPVRAARRDELAAIVAEAERRRELAASQERWSRDAARWLAGYPRWQGITWDTYPGEARPLGTVRAWVECWRGERRWAKGPVHILGLVGPPGTGKTSCAVLAALEMWRTFGERVHVASAHDVLRAVPSFDPAQRAIADAAKTAPVLVLDDLGVQRMTERRIASLYEVVDYRYVRQMKTLITSNATGTTFGEIMTGGEGADRDEVERIASRLDQCGRVVAWGVGNIRRAQT